MGILFAVRSLRFFRGPAFIEMRDKWKVVAATCSSGQPLSRHCGGVITMDDIAAVDINDNCGVDHRKSPNYTFKNFSSKMAMKLDVECAHGKLVYYPPLAAQLYETANSTGVRHSF
ncbi:hypothetical protein, partial [Rugamonas sp.]|uniref:hypothetical protein n=1 Tax=Rugamonas sp. TaxID=1926287 RepID=UPI0025E7C236